MATRKVDVDLDFNGVSKIIRALVNPLSADPGSPAVGEVWFNTTDDRLKVNTGGGIEPLAHLGDVTGGAITGTLWNAQTVITAVVDDTPQAQVIGEQEILGRRTGGNIGPVTFAQLLTDLEALGITSDTIGTSSEADLLARGNHTGTQTSATISDFNTAADARAQAIVDSLVDSAPGTLDTLNELAAALGDDPNFASTVTSSLATKTEKFATNIGNGALQTFTVNHALSSTDVVVSVRQNSDGAMLDAEVTVTDANNVQVTVNSTPTTDQYRVVVVG